MELEEAEDEEWDTTNSSGNVNCVLKRGLTLGKKILVAGFVASSAPLVLPPLVVASAIGLAVSMPYALFLASHTCTQNLMSKLLPRPTPQGPPLLEDMCFHPDIDIAYKSNEDLAVKGEAKRNNEMVDVNEKPMSGKFGNEIEEFETPFEFRGVTTVVLEESCEQIKEDGDIEEAELQRETKGLLEKIRDEGRSDIRGECVEGIDRDTNESDQNIGPVVENMEVEQEIDKHSLETELGEMRNEDDSKVCEEMLQLRNGDNMDTDSILKVVESGESVSGILEVESSNDSQKPMAETETSDSEVLDGKGFQYETILVESIGDLLIEAQVFNIPIAEESSEVISDKTDPHEIFKEEPEPTILQKGKSDDNISDFVNQEMQLNEDSKRMDLSDADARDIADESGLNLCDENRIDADAYSYTIDLHEESSNVTVDAHTDSMEVLVSSVEPESMSSACSSGKNIICPSEEVSFNEGDIWKQIHVIRKIIGYEGTAHASCADELKALYIFTGVEPPDFLKENAVDLAEINEKLHFLMSIVGIKSNVT